MKSIVTPEQKKLLNYISTSNISKLIYWTGGTALSEVYYQHRLSTDIDLFCYDIIEDIELHIFIKSVKQDLQIQKITHTSSKNRNLYNLDGIKMEIVYFPFAIIGETKKYHNIVVDSVENIATNKTLCLEQRNDPKDIFDLYYIFQNTNLTFDILIDNVEKKFGESLNKSSLLSKLEKNLTKLDTLTPLMFQNQSNDIDTIQKFFSEKNKKFFISILL